MFRCTPVSGQIIYCVPCDLSTNNRDDATEIVESGELVILVDDLEDLDEHFPNHSIQVV